MKTRLKFAHAVLYVLLLLVIGCGGGSVGTGTGGERELTVEGTIENTSGNPIPAALVTIIDTGDSDITDRDGRFSILTHSDSETLTLEVSVGNQTNTTTIEAMGEDGVISLTIKFNPLVDEIEVDRLKVSAKIVGRCDSYFENRRIIRQSNPAPQGVECTARVKVISAGLALAHVPIAIQFRRCGAGKPWTTTALGETMTGSNLGVAQIPFNFFDDPDHCLYQIVTPFGVAEVDPVIYEIQTFTYQASH